MISGRYELAGVLASLVIAFSAWEAYGRHLEGRARVLFLIGTITLMMVVRLGIAFLAKSKSR